MFSALKTTADRFIEIAENVHELFSNDPKDCVTYGAARLDLLVTFPFKGKVTYTYTQAPLR